MMPLISKGTHVGINKMCPITNMAFFLRFCIIIIAYFQTKIQTTEMARSSFWQ